MSVIEDVIKLAKDAESKLDATFDAPDVIPFAAAAIAIIEKHSNLQSEFEALFLEMPKYAPKEFVEVCIHALRWPSLKRELELRYRTAVDRNDWGTESVYRHFLEAFEPDWEDAKDFYVEYFGQHKAP